MRALGLVGALALVFGVASAATSYPDLISLPKGFQPEGIAIGSGNAFYVGSIPTGAIYRGDLQTGKGRVLVTPRTPQRAIGLEVDELNRVFVAGGPTGQAFVYDGITARRVASYRLASGNTFVNDVVVTKDAAFFTDSYRPFLYRIPIGQNGKLGRQAQVKAIPLSGDITYQSGFNVNGIDAVPSGKKLVLVQSNAGALFVVDPRTGVTDRIELQSGDVAAGDGILLSGRRLYVVQNALNRVAVVLLKANLGSGRIVKHLSDPDLDVPTTIDQLGDRLYVVNARFGAPNPSKAEYSVVQLR